MYNSIFDNGNDMATANIALGKSLGQGIGGTDLNSAGGNSMLSGILSSLGQFGDWAAQPNNQAILGLGGDLLTGLGGLYAGNQQNKMMQQMMGQNLLQWNKNYERQGQQYNEALYDRQAQRVSANANEMNPDEYVSKFGAK